MPSTTHDPENENMSAGNPPQPATGAAGANSDKTRTNPATGETEGEGHAQNRSAAEDRSPAAQKDRRIKPDD